MKKLKCASFFAGVGGIDLGFEQAGVFETIYANEFDKYPSRTFELNFPDIKVDIRDIQEVKSEEIPEFDVMFAGFPCQAFSIAGYRKGFDDEKGRGELFFELTRIIEDKYPRICFFENVKNLVGHDNGNTFKVICEQLDNLGYKYTYRVLNAMYYGNVAQNRERIYIVAFRDEEDYDKFQWPEEIPLNKSVRDIIDFASKVDEKYYYTEGKYKGDIYEKLTEAMKTDEKEDPAVYQWRRRYVRKNKSGVVPTLTANQGEGGHNVCLIHTDDNRIRKMTPRECFNTQGFPEDFKLPSDMSESRLYKQAGNSVCVSVIARIADNIKKAVD
ncbi:MAG: DNA cytosine methyltransferase [Dorea sp.]|nr:DNA cytosine methyltransferase [Dorea sp.]